MLMGSQGSSRSNGISQRDTNFKLRQVKIAVINYLMRTQLQKVIGTRFKIVLKFEILGFKPRLLHCCTFKNVK